MFYLVCSVCFQPICHMCRKVCVMPYHAATYFSLSRSQAYGMPTPSLLELYRHWLMVAVANLRA